LDQTDDKRKFVIGLRPAYAFGMVSGAFLCAIQYLLFALHRQSPDEGHVYIRVLTSVLILQNKFFSSLIQRPLAFWINVYKRRRAN
jgi:hypothetical protein